MERFDRFSINIFKDEEGDWLAHFVELPNISAFSDTPEGALMQLETAWEGVKESYQKHNEEIPRPYIEKLD
jgi:predicted RNase H-like HicB family nuclease